MKIQRASGVSRCRACTSRWSREYYHRSEARRLAQRRTYIRREDGVALSDLENLLLLQQERCAICSKHWTDCKTAKNSRYEESFLQHLYVDHDHQSGKVRGLLCNQCNCAIAFLEEDVERLPSVEAYLRKHKN